MTMHDAIKLVADNVEMIRADGPLHRQLTQLCEAYLYDTLRAASNGKI